MSANSPNSSRPVRTGALIGASYAIAIRLLVEILSRTGITGDASLLMSIAFLFLVPASSGALSVYLCLKSLDRHEWRETGLLKTLWIAILPMLMMVLFCIVTLLEGSICIIIALPALLICSGCGGVVMAWILSSRAEHSRFSVSTLALLPFLIAPLEQQFYHPVQRYSVRNELHIAASPDQVWQQLYQVNTIKRTELPLSLSQLIGIPLPLQADMDGSGVGATRTSTWERDVKFEEIITQWLPGEQLAYRFNFDHYAIPAQALDQHVRMGGAYFSPLSGAYQLRSDGHGGTWLSLTTTVEDRTHFGPYSRFWGELIFRDYHHLLLTLMKQRAERSKSDLQATPA